MYKNKDEHNKNPYKGSGVKTPCVLDQCIYVEWVRP